MNIWWEGYFFWEEQRLGELYAHFLLFIGKSCHLINPSKTKVLFCLFACPCSTEQQPYLLIWLLLLLSVAPMCLIPQFQNYFPAIKISGPCNFLTALLLGSEPSPWNWKESPLCWPEEKKNPIGLWDLFLLVAKLVSFWCCLLSHIAYLADGSEIWHNKDFNMYLDLDASPIFVSTNSTHKQMYILGFSGIYFLNAWNSQHVSNLLLCA